MARTRQPISQDVYHRVICGFSENAVPDADILAGVIIHRHMLGDETLNEIASDLGQRFDIVKGIHTQIIEKMARLEP